MNRRRKIVILILIVVIALAASYLLYLPHPRMEDVEESAIYVLDGFGRNVTITKFPERIVSTAPSNTEILFALGLGDKVVGVTKYCDYPPAVLNRVEAGDLIVVGGFSDPNIEKIVALNPDLILAALTVQQKFVKVLEDKGLIVVALDPQNITQALRSIELVGKISGNTEEAKELVNDMRLRVEKVRKMRSLMKPRVYYEVWYDPLISAGPGTWVDELIGLAGGINIFSDAKEQYPKVSSEAVIQLNPEIIIVPSRGHYRTGYPGGKTKEDFENRVGWTLIDAVKNNKIYEIEENLIIRPGPRIVQGLEELAKIIHSELSE